MRTTKSVFGAIAVAGLAIAGCANHHVAMSEVPAAPRATIEREATGGWVEKVEKETRDGQTYYEADIVVNGKKREVKVDETGRMMTDGR